MKSNDAAVMRQLDVVRAYLAGYRVGARLLLAGNPHPPGSAAAVSWNTGYDDALAERVPEEAGPTTPPTHHH